ncbi:LexA family protein [Endozoicomonas sp. ALE010]|uniref:LexA family protein n=1 Tax=Endozoicomonas sp. ALE010 TaxID=3403081 RepID=UPI003BB5258B
MATKHMSIGERIVQARKKKGWSQGRLSDEIEIATGRKITQQSIGQIENNQTKNPRYMADFAKVLGVTESYLRFGTDPNVSDPASIYSMRMVPLISWVSAGQFCEVSDVRYLQDPEDFLPCPEKVSNKAYALRVRGDSMTSQNPGGLSFPEGTNIYVDPEKEVSSGMPVIARLPESDECTFKIYVEDSGKKYLKPLNPQYPIHEIQAGTTICGVVVGQYMSLVS